MPSVYGIENPLMDIIFPVEYETLAKTGAQPGSMNLIDVKMMETVIGLEKSKGATEFVHTPGGSCANTIRGIAWLLGKNPGMESPAYSGAVGNDLNGAEFEVLLKNLGVIPRLSRTDSPTGVSIILRTPDHERTMFTFLGACREFKKQHVDFSLIFQSKYFYSTGYMWDTENQKEALLEAAEYANNNRIPIAFDLADPFVVSRYGIELKTWLRGKISILFANREEMRTMTGISGRDEDVIRAAGELAPTVVMKTGKDGCVILEKGTVLTIPGEAVSAVDTTGAGDSFAAGFMYGMLMGFDIESCGKLANRLASRIVTVEGCDFTRIDRADVLREGFQKKPRDAARRQYS